MQAAVVVILHTERDGKYRIQQELNEQPGSFHLTFTAQCNVHVKSEVMTNLYDKKHLIKRGAVTLLCLPFFINISCFEGLKTNPLLIPATQSQYISTLVC